LKASHRAKSTEPAGPVRVAAFAGPDLGYAVAEVAEISRIWGASGRPDGHPARRVDFYEAITSRDVVHVAAHGEHQAENPLFSSLRLADGPIYAYELDSSRLAAEHVVLSSCELGLATIRPGDEALGLTSVLLRLGTRSVISGVARVNDRLTSEVMVRYHRELAGGRDSAEALALACAPSSGGKPDDGSDLAAPFVCFGASWTARSNSQ
jgi:CHAT domain-containing protein